MMRRYVMMKRRELIRCDMIWISNVVEWNGRYGSDWYIGRLALLGNLYCRVVVTVF